MSLDVTLASNSSILWGHNNVEIVVEKGPCCPEVQVETIRLVSGCLGLTFRGATGQAQVCRKRWRATVRRCQSLLTLGKGVQVNLNFFNELGVLKTKNEKYSMGSSLMIIYTSSCRKVRLCGFHQSSKQATKRNKKLLNSQTSGRNIIPMQTGFPSY